MAKRLIIGIGQSMRRDDAAGIEAVKRWQRRYSKHIEDSELQVKLLELPGLALLDTLKMGESVLIVDAVRSGALPGSLYWLSEQGVDEFTRGSNSAHGWGVPETLAIGRQLQPELMPACVEIIGIEVYDIGMGDGLSDAVAEAMDYATEMIESWVIKTE